MQKVVLFSELNKIAQCMDNNVISHIHEGQSESFEGFENYDIIAFDWYDVHSSRTEDSQMLVYINRDNLFVLCEDTVAAERAQKIFSELEQENITANAQMLYRFFCKLLHGDMSHLDQLEVEINDGETDILSGKQRPYLECISTWRRELLRLKRYYEQLDIIFDEIADNENNLLATAETGHFSVLGNRTQRYLNSIQNLQEAVTQLGEAYQSQLSIQQNDLMKIFTVVTAVFLPLTLMVGWYGMNFSGMPELHWKYGYPLVCLVGLAVVLGLIYYFKKKKWL